MKRARIVLLGAAGRSTRSIAKEVGVQPRIVSVWRHRFADLGLEGLQDKPRPGKQPIYTKSTDKRILNCSINRRQPGSRAGPAPCWPGRWAMLTSNMSGGSCAATRSISRLASPGARATTRILRPKRKTAATQAAKIGVTIRDRGSQQAAKETIRIGLLVSQTKRLCIVGFQPHAPVHLFH